MPPPSVYSLAKLIICFSAPKGVERACPPPGLSANGHGPLVSVPRRALRGHAPCCAEAGRPSRSAVSVPRRALRGHAPKGTHTTEDIARIMVSVPRRALRGHAPLRGLWGGCPAVVSVPRRALRGHAPEGDPRIFQVWIVVSVPRRALRGHAPTFPRPARVVRTGFSAPKGVERACPSDLDHFLRYRSQVSVPRRALRGHAPAVNRAPWSLLCGFSDPKGVERACPAVRQAFALRHLPCFSAPKGVERACPPPSSRSLPPYAGVSVPRRALRGHAPCVSSGSGTGLPIRFSAPKGVERACPPSVRTGKVRIPPSFSAPKGVERACPAPSPSCPHHAIVVSVPRRALRGHAPRRPSGNQNRTTAFQCPEGR